MSKIKDIGYDELREPCLYGTGISVSNDVDAFRVGIHVSNIFDYDEYYTLEPADAIWIGCSCIIKGIAAAIMNIRPIKRKIMNNILRKVVD